MIKTTPPEATEAGPRLLSGGNPQIPKGYGEAPVQAYIAAMPGWKRALGERLDAIVARTVPGVARAVKWNSPFYGVEGEGWFLSFHCFTRYVKVTFFRGTSLDPVPPGASKHPEVRYLDIHEGALDEAQFADWVRQAAALEDPAGLFNASLDGNTRRAIDIREGEAIDAEALKALVRAAVALNLSARAARSGRGRKRPQGG